MSPISVCPGSLVLVRIRMHTEPSEVKCDHSKKILLTFICCRPSMRSLSVLLLILVGVESIQQQLQQTVAEKKNTACGPVDSYCQFNTKSLYPHSGVCHGTSTPCSCLTDYDEHACGDAPPLPKDPTYDHQVTLTLTLTLTLILPTTTRKKHTSRVIVPSSSQRRI